MSQNLIQRIRQNHGLEHATIHVLTEKFKGFGAQGNATHNGFYLNLYGRISAEEVETAAREALQRMQGGEQQLALHPNCGTVLLTTATMATLAGQAVFAVEQRRLKRPNLDVMGFLNVLPTAVLAVVLTLIASKPVGMYFQSYTTTGVVHEVRIKTVRQLTPSPLAHFFRVLLGRNKRGPMNSYFVETE
jgi:hypothetical protein